MSRNCRLIIEAADPLAEIMVYDGAFKRVGRDVGRYDGVLPNGLYEVRCRLGGTSREELIALDGDMILKLDPVEFASSIPFAGETADEAGHAAAIGAAFGHPVKAGAGSGLLLVVRDRPRSETSATPPTASAAAGLKLLGGPGFAPVDLAARAHPSGAAPVAALYVEVPPGVYRLRLDLPDGGARERSLVAIAGWRTECFMVRRQVRGQPLADLDQGAVSMARLGRPFTADDDRRRLAEAARDALLSHRRIADAAAEALYREKFEDPMLGLLVAHLLLRDSPHAPALDEVTDNLVRLLGPDHPDARAIALGTPQESGGAEIREMPMVRASWDRIVQHSLNRPGLVAADSPAGQVSARVLPAAPWLVWEPADTSSRRVDSQLAALRSYIGQAAERPPEAEAIHESAPGAPAPAAALDEDDRAELARSLGVPGSDLDDMLSRLGS
jgi:hypothetical protein